MLPEIRVNALTGDRVIVAPLRERRPGALRRPGTLAPPSELLCPFCPGNEDETTAELFRIPGGEAPGDWRVRVFANKYPVLVTAERRGADAAYDPLYEKQPAVGRHEVIVETPAHDRHFTEFGDRELLDVLRTYRSRFAVAAADARVGHVVIFRNQGELANASISHPHSQLAGLRFVPAAATRVLERSEKYLDSNGRNLLIDIAAGEIIAKPSRLVATQERFVSFVPFAPAHEFEVWVAPRFLPPRFDLVDDATLQDLGIALRSALRALRGGLDDPDYNYIFHVPPLVEHAESVVPWYIQIIPRLTPVAGFELGVGVQIVVNTPETAAQRLRETLRA